MRGWATTVLLGAVGAGLAAVYYARFVERTRLQLDRFTLRVNKPGLPPQGLTILHLSDLHCRAASRTQDRKLRRLLNAVAQEQYDIVALTGDLIHDQAGLPTVLDLIDKLQPRLGGFSCLGNHDYWESSIWGIFGAPSADVRPWTPVELVRAVGKLLDFARRVIRNERVYAKVAEHDVAGLNAALQAHGIQPLVNRAVRLRFDSVDLWIAGVDDLNQGEPDLAAALAPIPAGALTVLLAHNPDIWLEGAVLRADLILSGHTHGGQIRLPLLGAAHTQGTHLARRAAAGWFHRGTTHMFVTRGIGESLPLRLGVPPQAALIRLLPADAT